MISTADESVLTRATSGYLTHAAHLASIEFNPSAAMVNKMLLITELFVSHRFNECVFNMTCLVSYLGSMICCVISTGLMNKLCCSYWCHGLLNNLHHKWYYYSLCRFNSLVLQTCINLMQQVVRTQLLQGGRSCIKLPSLRRIAKGLKQVTCLEICRVSVIDLLPEVILWYVS